VSAKMKSPQAVQGRRITATVMTAERLIGENDTEECFPLRGAVHPRGPAGPSFGRAEH